MLTKVFKDYTIIEHFTANAVFINRMEKSPSLVEGARLEIV